MITEYDSDIFTDEFQHIGLCPEEDKDIAEIVTIDDGTGKLYEYVMHKKISYREYTITANFEVSPEEPTILTEAQIKPTIDDPYDVVGLKSKDHEGNETLDDINPVDYNLSDDGEVLELQEDESFSKILSTPRTQDVTQVVRYFTGWEVKDISLTKTIKKTNIPPKVCNSLDASCYTVPTHLFTSCSTDYEDTDPATLVTDWELYIDNNSYIEKDEDGVKTVVYDEDDSDYELLETHTGFTFYWVYSKEGRYKIKETTTDTDGDASTGDRFENIVFAECSKKEEDTTAFKGSGVIEVEANTWQLIAIPLQNSYWNSDSHTFVYDTDIISTIKNCVIDQLEDRYQVEAKELFKVANAYIGDKDIFYNYIPGFSKETSEHNFPLVYIDTDYDVDDDIVKKEIVGFWIKAKDQSFTINWSI